MEKQRTPFVCEGSDGFVLAFGNLYEQGNVQVLWRKSTGWTGEQYHSIAQMFGVEPDVCCVRIVDRLPTVYATELQIRNVR